MSKRRKGGAMRPFAAPPTVLPLPGDTPADRLAARPSRPVAWLQRLVVAAVLLGGGYGLWSLGRHIRTTGEYTYTLETSNGERPSSRSRSRNVHREVVHVEGDRAQEQALGFMAAGATLAFWGALVLLGPSGPSANPLAWTPLHSAITAVSLWGCLAAVASFFPPWRIGRSMGCNAFYIVMAAALYLATIRDRETLKERSLKVIPALLLSACVVGPFSTAYVLGIVAGLFLGLILASHILLLIPRARAELLRPQGRAVAP